MTVNVGVRLDVDGGPTFIRTVDRAARSVDDLGDQAGGASRQILQAASATSVLETALIGATAFKAVSGVFGAISGGAKLATVGVAGLAGGFAALSTAIPAAGILATLPGLGLSLAGGVGAAALATAGLGDALTALGEGDVDAIAKAMEKLPPAARGFAVELDALRPALDGLRDTAANGLFPGLSSGLADAMRALPQVNAMMSDSARVLGRLAEDAGAFVGSLDFRTDLGELGDSGARSLGMMGDAGLDLAAALTDVAVVAAPLTEWVTAGVASWAEWAAGAAEAGRASGGMAAALDETRLVVGWLVTGVGALARGAYELAGSGTDLLALSDALAEADRTGRLSVATWEDLARVVPRFGDEVDLVGDSLRALDAGGAAGLRAELETAFGPAVADMIGDVVDSAESVAAIFRDSVAPAFETLAAIGVPSVLDMIAGSLGWMEANSTFMEPFLAVLIGGLPVAAAGMWAFNAAMSANPIGVVVVALGGATAAFLHFWETNEGFVRWLGGAGQLILDVYGFMFSTVLNGAEMMLGAIASLVGALPDWAQQRLGLTGIAENAELGLARVSELRVGGEMLYEQYSRALEFTIETQAAEVALRGVQTQVTDLRTDLSNPMGLTIQAAVNAATAAPSGAPFLPPVAGPSVPGSMLPNDVYPAAPSAPATPADSGGGGAPRGAGGDGRVTNLGGVTIQLVQQPGESSMSLARRLKNDLDWIEAGEGGLR